MVAALDQLGGGAWIVTGDEFSEVEPCPDAVAAQLLAGLLDPVVVMVLGRGHLCARVPS
jgi:hypothetical protein